jgi:[acyl-carrier-protein] S-malonyltransferase
VNAPLAGLLFPGQGSQFVGMGRDLAERFPLARQTFAEADDALGAPLSRLCWEGPQPELVATRNAQPAILVHSVAVWRLVRERLPAVALAAGHSLGEFSAYVAAGSLGFVDALRTVRLRGELMYEAGRQRPGSMAALVGLDDDAVERLCAQASAADAAVVPANYNAPGQVVISGDVAAVERAAELARQAGAKRVIPLSVSGAFHSPLMRPAQPGLRDRVESLALQPPAFPVVSNVSAQPVAEAELAGRLLVEQLTAPVRWAASVRTMLDAGVTHFLELGPGAVLTGLVRRVERGAEARALGTGEQIEAFLSAEVATWS